MVAIQGQTLGEDNSLSAQNLRPPTQSADQLEPSVASNPLEVLASGSKDSIDFMAASSIENPSEALLPAFSGRSYSHLPTPQSPSNVGRYLPGIAYGQESPVSQSLHTMYLSDGSVQRNVSQKQTADELVSRVPYESQQCMTPESSPHARRMTPRRQDEGMIYRLSQPIQAFNSSAPRSGSSIKQESRASTPTSLVPAPRIPSPASSENHSHSSQLSSPFMAKLSIGDLHGKGKAVKPPRPQSYSPTPLPKNSEDLFSQPSSLLADTSSTMTLPSVPTPVSQSETPTTMGPVGGEMERARQALLEEHLARFREAEIRRPDYLKRSKRTLSETDPTTPDEDDILRSRDRGAAVGIMESPNKGRRLKLFQETSEESFEESLMAGGYGRYRTSDWVRQPQPVAVPSVAGSPHIVNLLENTQDVSPTKHELKKRKRLAAFRSEGGCNTANKSRLRVVELEGRGRVLLDTFEELPGPASIEPTHGKKRGGNRRKKKGAEPTKEKGTSRGAEITLEKPNWPDTEFPWRLRTEQRTELAKAEEEERLKWIERFLDRDTDDEGGSEDENLNHTDLNEGMMSSSKLDTIYDIDSDQPLPKVMMGRGKMVPLLAYPEDSRKIYKRKRRVFPSDPADARAALLSKKTVRALSYRQQRRQRELKDDEEEILCICHGKDDGRELVQCDGCQTWYHLQCIGIRNISDLGREEDPWFCQNCVSRSRSPSPFVDVAPTVYMEPTFVPTDDAPRVIRPHDAPFFQSSLQDSPTWDSQRIPKTPTRPEDHDSSDFDPGFTNSSSSWVHSSRPGPSTPQGHSRGVRVYTTTPSGTGIYSRTLDESPFDPTSTPSRGIRIGASFATPKNHVWPSRTNGIFHTPSKSGRGSGVRTYGGLGPVSGGDLISFGGYDTYNRPVYDESPIRRQSRESLKVPRMQDSPLMMRSSYGPSVGDSPVMGSKEKERLEEIGRRT